MACAANMKVWDLASGELMKLDGARGTTLRVTRGTLWLTQEHDTRDVVLSAGDVYTIDRGGLTLVEAQSKATVCILARGVHIARVPDTHASLAQRIREWVDGVAARTLTTRWVPYV